MNERERIHRICGDLDLPAGQWLLNGSAVMILHGIKRTRPMGDLDVFCATRVWFDLYEQRVMGVPWRLWVTDPMDPARRCDPPYLVREMYGLEVNVFSGWRTRHVGDIDVNFMIANAEEVDGLPCCFLQYFLDWKIAVGRAKDVEDIAAIRRYLGDPP